MIRHRRTFKNSYSFLRELIILIDFDILADLIEHNFCRIIFFRISKRKMYFNSINQDENIRL